MRAPRLTSRALELATALALVAGVMASSCAAPRLVARAPSTLAGGVVSGAFSYRVVPSGDASELSIEASVPAGGLYRVARRALPFLRDVTFDDGASSRPLSPQAHGFEVPPCPAGQACRLRYRFRLADAARAEGDIDLAEPYRGAFLSPPSSWLLRPGDVSAPYELEVSPSKGQSFISGLALSASHPDRFAGDVSRLDDTPYAAFGPLSVSRLSLPGASLDVAFTPGTFDLGEAEVKTWIDRSARAVAAYFGRFPIPHAALLVLVSPRARVADGHTMGFGGGSVVLSVGEHATARDLARDWILVHELCHLTFPNVRRAWAEEGMATYLEPMIRARAGTLDPDAVWQERLESLPKGQPEPGDEGLDHTDTWGRRYWGGAGFWLSADVEIRRRTKNRRSIDDAFRAIAEAGGNVSEVWDLDRTLAIGDRATGADVLVPLRHAMGDHPQPVDLEALSRDLGVSLRGGQVVYDDRAPLADLRRDMLRRR